MLARRRRRCGERRRTVHDGHFPLHDASRSTGDGAYRFHRTLTCSHERRLPSRANMRRRKPQAAQSIGVFGASGQSSAPARLGRFRRAKSAFCAGLGRFRRQPAAADRAARRFRLCRAKVALRAAAADLFNYCASHKEANWAAGVALGSRRAKHRYRDGGNIRGDGRPSPVAPPAFSRQSQPPTLAPSG